MDLRDYNIEYDEEKNDWLKTNRNICFDDILPLIEEYDWLAIVDHPDPQKYPGQSVFVLAFGGECYAVPFVMDVEKKLIFLKTLYPSRKLRGIYLKEAEHDG
jgi:hypothetical protein